MNLEKITFDSLPEAIKILLEKVERIERALDKQIQNSNLPPILDINKASDLSGRTPNAIRCQVKLGNIPYFKRDRRLYFETDKFLAWMRGELIVDEEDPLEILRKK